MATAHFSGHNVSTQQQCHLSRQYRKATTKFHNPKMLTQKLEPSQKVDLRQWYAAAKDPPAVFNLGFGGGHHETMLESGHHILYIKRVRVLRIQKCLPNRIPLQPLPRTRNTHYTAKLCTAYPALDLFWAALESTTKKHGLSSRTSAPRLLQPYSVRP